MSPVEILVALVAATVALALLARLAQVPSAVALVLGGMGVALVPGVPAIDLDPHLALALFLPPLLQASAYRTDWKAFRLALRPILLLALGAVLFTTASIAVVIHVLVPDLPWAAAIALGAIVAPPDAVAATAVLKTMRLPRHLVTVLEGESLLNDASSLIIYRFAVTAAIAGTASLSATDAAWSFVASSVGGAIMGFATGRLVILATRVLDDTLLEITAIVLAGFVSYIAAEQFHVSGVLAAVACGLVIGRGQHEVLSARTRVESTAVWNFLEFTLTSLVFILIGLQLRDVLGRLGDYSVGMLIAMALAMSGTLIASRFIWVFTSSWLGRLAPKRFHVGRAQMKTSHLIVVSWAGMRGVVSLAASLALPSGFPGRDLIIFLAFCAILVTLVLQGTTLGWLITRLHVSEVAEEHALQREASVRRAAAEAALATMEHRLFEGRTFGMPDRDMLHEFRRRAQDARLQETGPTLAARRRTARLQLELDAVHAARRAVLDHARVLDSEQLQAIEEEYDFEEGRLNRALHDPAHGR